MFRLEEKTKPASECTPLLGFLALNLTSCKKNLFCVPIQVLLPPFLTGSAPYLLPVEIFPSPFVRVDSDGAANHRFLTLGHKVDASLDLTSQSPSLGD